jgi:hypothetical protein
MLLDKELNSHIESGCSAYGLLCVLAFSTLIWNNMDKFNIFNTFKLPNTVVRVMSVVGPRSSCRSLFRKLIILPFACKYILSLMWF